MINVPLREISIESIRKAYGGIGLDNSVILLETTGGTLMPFEQRRLKGLFIGLGIAGTSQYTVDAKTYTLKENDIIIISDGQVASIDTVSDDFNSVAVIISSEFLSEVVRGVHELASLFLFSRRHPMCVLRPSEVEMAWDYFYIIKRNLERGEHHFLKETVSSLVTAAIYGVSNVIYRTQNTLCERQTKAEDTFTKFIELVERHYHSERRISWYAEKLYMTPKHLSEVIKQVSSYTPSDWIDKYVVLEIRVLLKNSGKSIKEIAHEMNFPNQSFLGKYFKEHAGMAPSEFRKSL